MTATAAFAHKPVLTGERTVLRPFTEADAATMAEIVADPEVLHGTGGGCADAFPPERLRAWYGSRGAQPDRLDLAVTDRATGELVGEVVGEVVLNEWDPANRSCTFRTLMGPRGRGRGLGTEAARMIVGYGFGALGLHRIQLMAFADNHRARHVYEKVGFVLEGVHRKSRLRDGVREDEVTMAVLAEDWPTSA
ncbi:GNAT family N-acetyltransferase [Streptomyces sp. VRA16 Mangrove soil]|uniref:GNAT family N-acetyltransferase n=1 Tax=Streptomyces sp. VRA16 Mangrove soil TaxID=2817434 RepID=UPI001A9DEB3E|nr:GNAT family protein [Streptomyces sp. VRA16 Mangrove soil]MBO1333173.1 GNAT family N-acetyltransferase [Streptomyces sp. VRA16 Mangrove soil]